MREVVPTPETVNLKARAAVPAGDIPAFRVMEAYGKKKDKNLLLSTWGGIGDQICAEPTLRWVTTSKDFEGCRFTLACDYPEMFAHLNFHDVYDLRKERPIVDDYFHFHVAVSQNSLFDQFISHMLVNCVDYPTEAAFRRTLYVKDKHVVLQPKEPITNINIHDLRCSELQNYVAVHPGKHWDSKTFPADWWNAVLKSIRDQGLTPVLLGAKDTKHGGGYVEVDRTGCIDLFDKTTIMESVWILQQLGVLICSDSSPLHMAASGKAFIGYVSTAKHPDYITHYRPNEKGVNEFGWRMQNFSLGGMWDLISSLPALEDKLVDKVDPQVLNSWLPDPSIFGPWCKERLHDFFGV